MGLQSGPFVPPAYPEPLGGPPRRDPANRLNIEPGMRVLVVGPDPEELVQEAAQRVGSDGHVVVVTRRQETADQLVSTWQQKREAPVKVHLGALDDLPVPDDRIDRAIAARVLGTAVDRRAMLDELRRVLKPGGLLGVEQRMTDRGSVGPRTIKQWCTAAGFERVRQYGSPQHYMLILWLKPHADGEPKGSTGMSQEL
jgi:ubiquinone/menaquinone biosynthesis C-methylase UbiE